MKTNGEKGVLNSWSVPHGLAASIVCGVFLCLTLLSQSFDAGYMQAVPQRFQLVIGPEVKVSMQDILRVLSGSGTDGKPTWTKPTAFGTGGWTMKLGGTVLGEWFAAGQTRTQPVLRLGGSAFLFTSNACIVAVHPDSLFTVAGERLGKTRILATLPAEAILGQMADWLLSGAAGVVSIAESGADSGKTLWRWERNYERPFSLLLYVNERPSPDVERVSRPRASVVAAELKRLLEIVRASGKSNPLKAEQAAMACYRFLEQNDYDAPQGARELRNQTALWLERLQAEKRGIEQARIGDFQSRPYRVARAEKARDEMVEKYEVVRTQMIQYLSKWEHQLAASAQAMPAPEGANRASADGGVVLCVDGVPIVRMATGNQQKEEP